MASHGSIHHVEEHGQRSPIRTRIYVGLGGTVAFGLLLLGATTVYQLLAASQVSDQTLAGYRLVDDVRGLQAATERSRASVMSALVVASPQTLQAVQVADDEVQSLERQLLGDVALDPSLGGEYNKSLAAYNTWHDVWAVPVNSALSDQLPLDARANLSLEVGDRLFGEVRLHLEALAAATQARLTAMLAGFRERATMMVTGLAISALLLMFGVLIVGVWIVRVVITPLRRLNETAVAQLRGDAVEFVPERDDEVGALASVLERLRLALEGRYHEAHADSVRAATLHQLGDLISFSVEEIEVINATVRTLQRVAPTRRGDIQLVNASRNRLVYSGAWGPEPPDLGAPVPVDRVDRCPAIRRSAPFVVPDLTDDLAVLCAAHPVKQGSLACVPLIAMGQPIGVIHLESDTPISDQTVADAGRIAEQVAVAVANARLMKTMEGLAMTDGLTGLRNARFFDTYLEQELAATERDAEPLTVLMIDIDHFKQFNDTYGHPGGDEALRVFGRVVKSSIRSSDVAARYGGEEFIVALRHTDLEGAILVAEKIREAVASAVVDLGAGRFGKFTISAGIAAVDLKHVDQKMVIAAADAALYNAKSNGRNQVVVNRDAAGFSPAIRESQAADAATGGPAAHKVVQIRSRRRAGTGRADGAGASGAGLGG